MKFNKINTAEEYYAAMTKFIAVTSVILLPGFAINNFMQGRILVGIISAAVISILVLNAFLVIRLGYSALRTFLLQIPPILYFIYIVFLNQGVIGALWCTPALLSFYFMLPERYAWGSSVLLIILATTMASIVLEPHIAFRVFATLTISSIFSAIFVRIIVYQRKQLRHQAVSDPLTGLKNRMLLDSSLEQANKYSKRNRIPMTLLVMDLDHFKKINDELGHAAGDQVLVCVAKVIKSRVRESDMSFRIGGEEFLCLLYNCDEENGKELAEKIRLEIQEKCLQPDRSVTTSIGVASILPEEDTRNWLKRADNNLYQAKSMGRNRTVST